MRNNFSYCFVCEYEYEIVSIDCWSVWHAILDSSYEVQLFLDFAPTFHVLTFNISVFSLRLAWVVQDGIESTNKYGWQKLKTNTKDTKRFHALTGCDYELKIVRICLMFLYYVDT